MAACFRRDLLRSNSGGGGDPEEYTTDRITSFLMTADHKKLIVLGEHYHYIFDMPPGLDTTLDAPFRVYVEASFSGFEASGSDIKGAYTRRLMKGDYIPGRVINVTDAMVQAAVNAGFVLENRSYVLKGEVSGHRYDASTFKSTEKLQHFNKDYYVFVHEQKTASVAGTIARIPLTPLAIAADGALFVASIPVAIIAFPLIVPYLALGGCNYMLAGPGGCS